MVGSALKRCATSNRLRRSEAGRSEEGCCGWPVNTGQESW